MKNFKKTKRAFGLAEILLSIGILSVVILGLAGSLAYSIQASSSVSKRRKATFLLEEGLEATRAIRDDSYSSLTNGTHGLDHSGSTWVFSGASDTVDEFTRTISISTVAPNTKQVTVTIQWDGLPLGTNQISASSNLTDWLRAVSLSSDWTNPQERNSENTSGGNNGYAVVYDTLGYVYLTRYNGNPELYIYDATDLDNLIQVSSLNISSNNFASAYANNYLYIGSSDDNDQIQIIDVTNRNAPNNISSLNPTFTYDIYDVFIKGNYLYAASQSSWWGEEFFIFDLTNPASPNLIGSEDIGNNVYAIYISGNYAYLGTSHNSYEVVVVDISNKFNPQAVATVNLSGSDNVGAIWGYGNYIYAGRQGSGQIVSLDVSNPLFPSVLDTYTVGDDIRDLKIDNTGNYLFAGSDHSTEFRSFDISDPSNITQVGSLNIGDDINDLFYETSLDILFGATDDNNRELLIIEGS